MPATAARSNAAVPDDSAMTNLGTPPRRLMMNWISTRPRRPMRALCGITESQLVRTAASTCTRYGLKSTPAGSLRSCRLLRAGPGEGALGVARVVTSSMSPIMIPPAGVAGGELAGADGVRRTSAVVLAIGGSFTLGFEFGWGEAP